MEEQPRRKNLAQPQPPAEEMPEDLAPPMQGRNLHGPLSDDLISPEDANGNNENTAPDEKDAYGNVIEHEGEWTQQPANDLTDEDTADTRDWRGVPVDPKTFTEGWNNEKRPES